MIRKILIANRGEIAVRVIRACSELGIQTVAVYSDSDIDALHVQTADEAICIGPPTATQSYLNVPVILEAARRSGADAVHPGYGFLSENAQFADACLLAGLTFIGPPASAIRAMADKAAAKRLMEQAGVPVVPGYHAAAAEDAVLAREAERIGYPLLVKASGGGGGRGMRVVTNAEDLPEALASARREALSGFGDDRLLLERYLPNPRHIEVQVLFDSHGNGVVLGERECSLQRRHQKVVEEAPAPCLAPELRRDLHEAASRAAAAIGYVNAGTVEFLVAGNEFFFLEMNTRLQVEHGVTELVTGIDLVQQQIAIADGKPLPFGQADIHVRGHAIESRLYAEDPHLGFRPSPGRLLLFEPPHGPGIRNDLGVYQGGDVSQYYDPLIAKLLVYGADRPQAIERMRRALESYVVAGVATNIPLLEFIATHPAFVAGETSTQVLEEVILPAFLAESRVIPCEVLLAAGGLETLTESARGGPAAIGNPWRIVGARGGTLTERVFIYEVEGETAEVRVAQNSAGSWKVRVRDEERIVEWRRVPNDRLIVIDDRKVEQFAVAPTERGISVAWRGRSYDLRYKSRPGRTTRTRSGAPAAGESLGLTAPMPAVVIKVVVHEGEEVRAGQTVMLLEAMKMEHRIVAVIAGTVGKVHHQEGDRVAQGAVLMEIG